LNLVSGTVIVEAVCKGLRRELRRTDPMGLEWGSARKDAKW
jgi:hypothetical protein